MLDILVDVLLDTLGEIVHRSSRQNKESDEGGKANSPRRAASTSRKNAGAPRSAPRPARAKRRKKDRSRDAIEVLRVGR